MSILENKQRFCNRLKALREGKKLTVEELAQCSGVALTILEELEREVLPDEMMLHDAILLAKAFDCKIYELFE